MTDDSSGPHPLAMRFATCPMCHTPRSGAGSAADGGDAWRCVTCGQYWNAERIAAVAAYAAWSIEHDRAGGVAAEARKNRVTE
jgi:hypothetical protein